MQKESRKKEVKTSFTSLMETMRFYQPQNFLEIARRVRMGGEETALDYTVEEAREIISSGTQKQKRTLSNYMFKVSGIYRRAIMTASTLPTYNYEVLPITLRPDLEISVIEEVELKKNLFLQNSNIRGDLATVMFYIFKDGRYYGLIREKEDGRGMFVQDLPVEFCRIRNKDLYGRWIIEFDLRYFDNVPVESGEDRAKIRVAALESMPKEIIDAYNAFKAQKIGHWVVLNSEQTLAIVPFDGDPLIMGGIPDLINLMDTKDIVKGIDKQALKKLVISQLPLDKDGNLVFDLEEAGEIHQTMASILQDSMVDILTTFGETEVANLEARDSLQGDKLAKVERNSYNELGLPSTMFNPDSSTATQYAIENLQSLVFSVFPEIENSLSIYIGNTQGLPNRVDFSFKLLRVSHYNREDVLAELETAAGFGFPVKTTVMSLLGYTPMELSSKMMIENDLLKLHEKMIPVQSTHTGGAEAILDKGGRKEKDDKEKSDKTIQNKG